MQKNEENVLVIRRALFDDLGAFQGLERDVDRYIETFMTRQNNFFLPRSRAEQDPAFKQIIPYVIFTFENTILRYVREHPSEIGDRIVAAALIATSAGDLPALG